MSFKSDITGTQGLQNAWREGIQALAASDRERLDAVNSHDLRGSANIDSALQATYPEGNRWDYAVGYQYGSEERVHFIEVHPASGMSDIRVVEAKAAWLLNWVRSTPLRTRPRFLHWVVTDKSCFNQAHPKLRALAQKGVIFSGRKLKLGKDAR